jgi:hypothetical protein
MKRYKLKQSIVVTETGAAVMAKVIKKDTTLYEKTNHYTLEQDAITTKVVFNKHDIENTPELFELIPEIKQNKVVYA